MTRLDGRTALALVLLLSGLAGCESGSSTPPVQPATNATTVPLLPTTVDALPATDPETWDALLVQLRGTPVVVNFWASWCDPCEREAPVFNAAHARYGDRVQFLGVDMQDFRDGAIRFLAEQEVRYPSVFDPENRIGLGHDLFAPPMTIVYDEAGRAAVTLPGEVSEADLNEALAAVLDG